MIGGIGLPELLLIAGVCLLVFGPNKLPKVGRTLGRTLSSFKDGVLGNDDDEGPKTAPSGKTGDADEAGDEGPSRPKSDATDVTDSVQLVRGPKGRDAAHVGETR